MHVDCPVVHAVRLVVDGTRFVVDTIRAVTDASCPVKDANLLVAAAFSPVTDGYPAQRSCVEMDLPKLQTT